MEIDLIKFILDISKSHRFSECMIESWLLHGISLFTYSFSTEMNDKNTVRTTVRWFARHCGFTDGDKSMTI